MNIIKLLNTDNEEIDPATEDTLAAVLAKLTADPATQTTLAALLLTLQTVTAKAFTVVTKAVAAPGTGVSLVVEPTYASRLFLTAKKATGSNAGNAFIGTSAVDRATDQQTILEPGDTFPVDVPPGVKFDLATIYIDADNAADGVTGWYIPA